jgi:hypothetical protein
MRLSRFLHILRESDAAFYEFHDLIQTEFDKVIEEYHSGRFALMPWRVIPARSLITCWNQHARTGQVRNPRALGRIVEQMLVNVARLTITTELSGHTQMSFEDTLESYGYEGSFETEPEREKFIDWAVDTPEGHWRLSDYGLKPLQALAVELIATDNPDQQLVLLDRMLNVTHQRSDLAAWFVQGGTATLNQLAGKDEESIAQQRDEFRSELRQNRNWSESLTESVRITPAFLKQVMARANRIARDIAADLPQGPELVARIEVILANIQRECAHGNVLVIQRDELRAREQLGLTQTKGRVRVAALGSVGCHWAWGEPGVYHHDNAMDDAERNGFSRDQLVNFRMTGEVRSRDVDWPFTIATNLILPGEEEVTVKPNAKMKITDIVGDRWWDSTPQNVVTSGYYMTEGLSE